MGTIRRRFELRRRSCEQIRREKNGASATSFILYLYHHKSDDEYSAAFPFDHADGLSTLHDIHHYGDVVEPGVINT